MYSQYRLYSTREIIWFFSKKTQSIWKQFNYKDKISITEFTKYNQSKNKVLDAWYNSQTLNYIKDGNSFAKGKLEVIDKNHYRFMTPLIVNKYKEEVFYYCGKDDQALQEKENKIILNNARYFCIKYLFQFNKIKELETIIDHEIMEYAKEKVLMDLNKLDSKTSSTVFKNLKNLSFVLAYLYYIAFVRVLLIQQKKIANKKIDYNEYLIEFNKLDLIVKISTYFNINEKITTNIINYLINTGYENIREFPLYEHSGSLYTTSSLIMLNDWSFSIVNGHYIKGIEFKRREKTISVSTERKLDSTLKNAKNIIYAKEKNYNFIDNDGTLQNSDIDFAILDKKRKKLLIIETKWKDNHYKDGEKNYIKIEDTLNKIFTKQISKHKKFLTCNKNLNFLFDNKININLDELEIFYIAIDKRNQLHIGNHHMLTEYLLLYLIKSNIYDDELNLENVINNINKLKTETKYIFNEPVHTIKLSNGTLIEFDDIDYLK